MTGGGAGENAQPEKPALRKGMTVKIQGLKKMGNLNGKVGWIVSQDQATKRWEVHVSGMQGMLLRASNLIPTTRSSKERHVWMEEPLDADIAVQWVSEAEDEFEAMLLPLELELDAAKIRKRFRQLSLMVHPDKTQHPSGEIAFRKLYAAMEKLSDPVEQRAAFRRIRRQSGKVGGSDPQPDLDDDHIPWWMYGTPNDMEKAFRQLEARLEKIGAFKEAKHRFNSVTGVDEDDLWVTCEDAKELMDKDLAIFVDSRGYMDWMTSCIPSSVNIEGTMHYQVAAASAMPEVREMAESPEQFIIVYSDNGSSMSRCVDIARQLRITDKIQASRVLRLQNGLNGWKRQGLPVEGDRRPQFAGHALGPDGVPLTHGLDALEEG